eukprot:3610923-Rhodomonas_salina.6
MTFVPLGEETASLTNPTKKEHAEKQRNYEKKAVRRADEKTFRWGAMLLQDEDSFFFFFVQKESGVDNFWTIWGSLLPHCCT